MPQKSLPLPLLSNTIKIKRNYQKQEDKKKSEIPKPIKPKKEIKPINERSALDLFK